MSAVQARARPDAPSLADLISRSARDAYEALDSSPDGLSDGVARERSARYGPNRLPRAKAPEPVRQLAAQFVHFFAVMLWGAAALAFVGGMPQLAWAIIAVVVLNGVFAFVQEYRADRATRALSALLPPTVTVMRDHHRARVGAEDLVPGDVVLLGEGDRIPADARVVRAEGMKVDTSMLTGESEPVPRDARPAAPGSDPATAGDVVFAGTYVTSGTGTALVVGTGDRTMIASISRMTSEVVRRPTPLRLDLDRVVRIIAGVAVACGAVFFAVSSGVGMRPRDGFLFAVGVIVALVPEGLLPTLTLSMALSAKRMAGRGTLVRHLEAVETLGATTVICSDKTGTITANQMTARAVVTAGQRWRVSGSGYGPEGTFLHDDRPLTTEELALAGPLLRAASLCGDARLTREGERWRCVGDPTEGALVVLARKGGVERDDVERRAPRVLEFPFESTRRRMSTVHALPSGSFEILAKGSPESILEVTTTVREHGRSAPLSVEAHMRIEGDIEALARAGLRVIALGRRVTDTVPGDAGDAERGLELLGLVGMEDPVRPEVPDAIARCRSAGIRVVMVTGDHPATAEVVARRAGLRSGAVIPGSDIPEDDEALAQMLDGDVAVIARVAPDQKLRIARAFQAHGHVVAMTGDGVNDAPALRQADIGIAMGRAGTDVAREAADLVLLDDNFAHIVEAVEEGRAAFDNIKRFLTYHLTDNVAELAPFAAWALSGGSIPLALSVLQILALDIGTDLLPALALGAERPEAGTMTRAPRARTARLIDRRVLGRAFGFLGPVEALLSLAMLPLGAALFFGWRPGSALPSGGVELATLSTMVFAAIVLCQMANAFECRSTPASLFRIGPLSNRVLSAAVAIEALALLGFVYLAPLRRALGQHALSLGQWGPIAVAPLLLLMVEEARKMVVRSHRGGT